MKKYKLLILIVLLLTPFNLAISNALKLQSNSQEDFVTLFGNEYEKIENNQYKSQIKSSTHPRSTNGIINLAKYRGQFINSKYAESFRIIRGMI